MIIVLSSPFLKEGLNLKNYKVVSTSSISIFHYVFIWLNGVSGICTLWIIECRNIFEVIWIACKNYIQIQLQGMLQAPIDLTGEHWISFQYIDQFTLTGIGVVDGQRKVAWGKNDCDKNPKCDKRPIVRRI